MEAEPLILQGYAQVSGQFILTGGLSGGAAPPDEGTIDTAPERLGAFLDPWAIVMPDGAIDGGDRGTLVGHYPREFVPPPLPYQITKFWQTRMFKHRADIWEPIRSADPDGDVNPAVYLPRYSGVPCWCTRMPSASQVEMFGRTEQDDLFTRDLWFFHEHQPIGDSWLIVLRTVDSHGVQHPDYGKAWICAGDDRVFVDSIGDEGHRQIVAVAQPVMPAGVS